MVVRPKLKAARSELRNRDDCGESDGQYLGLSAADGFADPEGNTSDPGTGSQIAGPTGVIGHGMQQEHTCERGRSYDFSREENRCASLIVSSRGGS